MRIKIDSNKGIFPDLCVNVLDGCKDYNDELPLVDPSMKFPPFQL